MSDSPDTDVAQYQSFSALAVVGLIFACLSVFALVDPVAWVLPLAGIILSGLALRRIARNSPTLTGRKVALAGLLLSLFLGGAASGEWFAHRWLLRGQARQFAQVWFDLLRAEQPQKAYQLTRRRGSRQPLDATLWAYYRKNPQSREELDNYVTRPEVRTLLALGKKDQVRYYLTESQSRDGNRENVTQAYAVTYDDAGAKKTFFVRLTLERSAIRSGGSGWRIVQSEGGIRPTSMPEEKTPAE